MKQKKTNTWSIQKLVRFTSIYEVLMNLTFIEQRENYLIFQDQISGVYTIWISNVTTMFFSDMEEVEQFISN